MSTNIGATEIYNALGGRRYGRQYLVHCPSHDDKNPSLAVKDSPDGNVLLHCFAGCSFQEVRDALRQRGLWSSSSYFRKLSLPPGIRKMFHDKFYVAHWVYRNEHGEVIGYEVRYERDGDKEVIPYFKKNQEKWEPGYPKEDFTRPLYRLNKIAETPEDEDIWIVEGPKCSDTLSQLGVLATTSPGGAKSSSKTDWSPLAGRRRIIIWPDNDDAGKDYAVKVFNEIRKVNENAEIRLVDIGQLELAEKGDVEDWINKGYGRNDLSDIPLKPIKDFSDMQVVVIRDGYLSKAIDKAETLLMDRKPNKIFERGGNYLG